MNLCDARCRLKQAKAVLDIWLESPSDEFEANLIASILTLLDGVDKAIDEAETNLTKK